MEYKGQGAAAADFINRCYPFFQPFVDILHSEFHIFLVMLAPRAAFWRSA
jgi:hypothetical protein